MTSFNDGTAIGRTLFVPFMCSIVLKYNVLITLARVDYSFTRSEVTFSATTSSQVVTIPIIDDPVLESSETINVTLTSVDPAAILSPASAVITLDDNDGK